MTDTPALRARIEKAKTESPNGIVFAPEQDRVSTVITKLAQGHALYELHDPCTGKPDTIQISPLGLMSVDELQAFEHPRPPAIWPEVGSRAMQRLVMADSQPESPWIVVQDGLYRFHASPDFRVSIRIVISEYLACYVRWD